MRLHEIYEVKPRFAWWEDATNSGGMKGVRLAFVEPTIPRFDAQEADADERHDDARLQRIQQKKDNYRRQGHLTFPNAPDLGFWETTQHFEDNETNERGFNKGNLYQKYPSLEIFPSREEAEKAARKAGLIKA